MPGPVWIHECSTKSSESRCVFDMREAEFQEKIHLGCEKAGLEATRRYDVVIN